MTLIVLYVETLMYFDQLLVVYLLCEYFASGFSFVDPSNINKLHTKLLNFSFIIVLCI